MTQYKRPDETVFASGAKTGEVENFPDIARGWGVSFDQTNGIPPMEWFNALFKRNDEALRYLLQRGIAEWSATEDYPVGAHVQHDGKLWRSAKNHIGIKPVANSTTWELLKATQKELDEAYSSANHSHSFASITNKPSTLDGYGILDGLTPKSIWLPFSALPLAVVSTDDGRMPVTAESLSGGAGRVSIPAGISLSLAVEVESSKKGFVKEFLTPIWTSPVLAANSEYFLRGQVANGGLLMYVQKGKLSDAVPLSLKGSPVADSGGGFNTTALDVCLARIITGAAGTVPVVQRIINRRENSWSVVLNGSGTLYLPLDPQVKTVSGSASCLMPPESGLSDINFGGDGWIGASYVYGVPGNSGLMSSGYWNGYSSLVVSSNNLVGDVFQTAINVGFDHANGRSMWQTYQAEHTYADKSHASDELLLGMGLMKIQASDYENGVALFYRNCSGASFTWSVFK